MLLNFLTLIIVSMLCCHAVIIIRATPWYSLSLSANPLNRYLLIHALYSHTLTLSYTHARTFFHYSTETRPDVIRMQGQVSRPKVRVRGGGADGAGYELCEIKEVKTVSLGEDSSLPAESTPSGAIFFCDFREPKLAG